MISEIRFGLLTFVGDRLGDHVHVTVLGVGAPGHRPLCGRFVTSVREWTELETLTVVDPPPAGLIADPHASLMWAIVRGLQHPDKAAPGQLAVFEVPPNCTIHDADARKLGHIVSLARQIGEHWRGQEGVNAALIDELAEVTAP